MVVADQRSPRDGRIIETVGRYNAQTDPSQVVLDEERLDHWIARGAQPTDTVRRLMLIHRRAGGSATGGDRVTPEAESPEPAGAEPDAAPIEPSGAEPDAAPGSGEQET